MELDKRIKEGKRPLTCFDLKEAEKFIGKECYFSSKLENFENLSKVSHANLYNVDDSSTPFQCYGDDGILCYDCFILPCEWVMEEEPEPKYRAFTLNEFLKSYKIGDTVTFRLKKDGHAPEKECLVEYTGMITGYESLPEDRDKPGKSSVFLGGCPSISLSRLFEFYELQNKYYYPIVWQPFGVIEDE